MDVILIACLCFCVTCGYIDAEESAECFRTGKAVETNSAIRKLFGPKPSLAQMMAFNLVCQFGLFAFGWFAPWAPAIYFVATLFVFRGAQHLTQAYWGFCLNAGKPTPKVDKWWQQFFWQHDNVEG